MNRKAELIVDKALADIAAALADDGGASVYSVMLTCAYFTNGLLCVLPPDCMASMHEDFMALKPTERTRVAMDLMARLDADIAKIQTGSSQCH